jgi:hypothetical protein
MPLPTLTWRAFAPVTLAANTTAAIMDAIYANGLAATYADGSARPAPGTAGSTSWSWAREQATGVTVAVYGTPPAPASGVVIPTKYIVAGASTLPGTGPTMATVNNVANIDTNAVNRLNIGMVKNPGAYTTWSAANPFTSGTFSGYVNVSQATTAVTFVSLRMWECQEGFICQLFTAGGAASYPFGGGALVDPLTSAASGAETDGRIYTVTSVGSGGSYTTAQLSTTATNTYGIFLGKTGANNSRFIGWWPGAGPTYLNSIMRLGGWTGMSATLVSPNGDLPKIPYPVYWAGQSSGQGAIAASAGQLRQIYITRNAGGATTWTNGATTVGYILSPVVGTANEAILLAY